METGRPSRTALAAARHRAAHQVLEGGRIFSDPLAMRILGADGEAAVRDARAHPALGPMRWFVAARTRFAEDAAAAAVAGGVRQVVVLGAGLDTYAYRSPHPEVRVFEVDHPDTQVWKRACLEAAGIAVPASLTFAPIDFERRTLATGLELAGFDRSRPAFFLWLGVTVYLSEETIWSTLAWIGASPQGAHVVFDYAEPIESRTGVARARMARRLALAASVGEPWVSFFEPERMHARLTELGFGAIEDLGPHEIAERYFPSVPAASPQGGGHVLRASTLQVLP